MILLLITLPEDVPLGNVVINVRYRKARNKRNLVTRNIEMFSRPFFDKKLAEEIVSDLFMIYRMRCTGQMMTLTFPLQKKSTR